MRIKTSLVIALLMFGLVLPNVSYASTLSTVQVNAIAALLEAFGAGRETVANVRNLLSASALVGVSTSPSDPAPVTTTLAAPAPYVPPEDDVYPFGSLGFDLSFDTKAYPVDPFGFAVVGVSGGRAFSDNARLVSEYKWAQNFATRAAPTFYLNLNAPYGARATGANVESPMACATPFGASTTSASAGGTYPDPAPCAGYNYGYHTAEHSYEYATAQGVSARFWWLDIEEANSWSENAAVNDAVIQGAIDALNAHGVRVGIYSMTFMWNNIAGKGFVPTQTISGKTVPIPVWFPIGVATRTEAINACHTAPSFIPGMPVWIIQYEADSTAVDQNITC